MVADLFALNQDVCIPSGLLIRQVVDQKTLLDWRHVFTPAYEMPEAGGQSWYDAPIEAGGHRSPERPFNPD
jgi:hypothetical protein